VCDLSLYVCVCLIDVLKYLMLDLKMLTHFYYASHTTHIYIHICNHNIQQMRVLASLRHPNIISLVSIFENEHELMLVMERAHGG
jgi:serine/threonine protein kinase